MLPQHFMQINSLTIEVFNINIEFFSNKVFLKIKYLKKKRLIHCASVPQRSGGQ